MRIDFEDSVYMEVDDIYFEMSKTERKEMLELLTSDEQPDNLFGINSLEDELKVEKLREVFHSLTLKEVEEFVNSKK